MIACCANSIILTISPDSGSYCGETALYNEEYRAEYPKFQFHTNVVAKSPFLSFQYGHKANAHEKVRHWPDRVNLAYVLT